MENRIEYTEDRVIKDVICESTGEYSLPDYNGDIKKILHVGTSVIPSGKFLDGDNLEFSGIVSYDVVYLDGENNITHLGFTTDYEMSVRCSGERFMESDIDTSIENCNLRPIGPRKLSAKAVLSSDVHIMERCEISYEGDTFSLGNPEMLEAEARIRTSFVDTSAEREWAEELGHLDGVIADEVEVLYTGCDVKIDERELDRTGGQHSGELVVYSLIKCKDDVPYLIERTIPFKESFFTSGELPSDIIPESCTVSSGVTVMSVGTSVLADADGTGITASIITEGKMRVSRNTPVTLVRECYLPSCKTECEHDELVYTELVGCGEKCEKFVRELERQEVCQGEVKSFLLSDARATVNSTELFESSAKVCGNIRFSGIACEISESGETLCSNVKVDVPFEQKVNISCHIPDGARAESTVSATASTITADRDKLVFECEMCCNVAVVCDRRESYVSMSVMCDEKYESDPTLVTVYYPEDGETLFDVSRKFHKPMIAVAAANALTESVFADKTSSLSALGIKKVVIR